MLTRCPECKHQCSDKADACPHCGCPLRPLAPPIQGMAQAARMSRPADVVVKSHRSVSILAWILIPLACVLTIIVVGPCVLMSIGWISYAALSPVDDSPVAPLAPIDFTGVVPMRASALERAFASNPVAAQKKYADAPVIIEGRIASVGKRTSGTLYITLATHGPGVECQFDDEADILDVATDEDVRVGCVFEERSKYWRHLVLVRCEFQEVEQHKAATRTPRTRRNRHTD